MSSGLALFASITVTPAGISLLTVQSVTFNGAECSTPAAIDGVVYMHFGRGSRTKDLHCVRHIEGVCEKIHKGTVCVGFWVGKCSSANSADAWTGWGGVSQIYVKEIPPPQA